LGTSRVATHGRRVEETYYSRRAQSFKRICQVTPMSTPI